MEGEDCFDGDTDSCMDINSSNFNADLYLKETFKVCDDLVL